MASPKSPGIDIPKSKNVAKVSVINTNARLRGAFSFFVKNPLPGHETIDIPALSFLLEHSSSRKKVLFDLGVRKDVDSLPPVVRQMVRDHFIFDVEKEVAAVLADDGRVKPEHIDSIIWSHWHVDHVGDMSTFPSTTELVVGPGFKDALLPGYPTNPEGVVDESDYKDRHLREVQFSPGFEIGGYQAMDYFGDGSFYLLDCPGHTVGHMMGLARTTESTFILMGGDCCHHAGSLRPTERLPIPDSLSPSPFSEPPHLPGTTCPGALLEGIHPKRSRTEPFYPELSPAADRDLGVAEASIRKLREFDADENVFVAIAHDRGLLGVIDFFPAPANEWKQKGWKEASRWRFLEDFRALAGEVSGTVPA